MKQEFQYKVIGWCLVGLALCVIISKSILLLTVTLVASDTK
jgi:hypothetical protein